MKNKFRLFAAAITVIALTVTSCKHIDDLTTFSVDYDTKFTVPATTVIVPFEISTPEIESGSNGEFASENTHKNRIESVYINGMVVTIDSPEGADFSFLSDVAIYVSADGVGEKKVAWKDPVPESTGGQLVLDVTDEPITEYVKADSFTYRVTFSTDETLSEDHDLNLYSDFKVKAKIF